MHAFRHCTAALVLVCVAATAAAQTAGTPPQPAPATGEASFVVFIGGTDMGRVQSSVSRSGSDWIVTGTGRVGALTVSRFEVKFGADWQPIEMHI